MFDDYTTTASEVKYREIEAQWLKKIRGRRMKILFPKHMIHRLPAVLAQAEAGVISENLLNNFRQIIYSCYRAKQISKQV